MRLSSCRERNAKIRRGQARGSAFRPFDEPQITRLRPVAYAQRFELRLILQPIQIKMHGCECPQIIEFHERVRRAAYGHRDAAGKEKSPCPGRLAGSQITVQIYDCE